MNDNESIVVEDRPLFPITVMAGDSKVVLYANGIMVGDPGKLQAGLEALTMADNSIGAVVLWLLLRELRSDRSAAVGSTTEPGGGVEL